MPKKIAVLTDWVTIGTAGPTVDGRNIPDTALAEMAETYDPEVYTAVINAEHYLGFGSFGQVRELRAGKSKDGKPTLEARLEPNSRLLDMANYGQRLFTSMEIIEDFAKTGKAYLVGLAVTDMPASLGTTELRFSRQGAPTQYRAAPVELAAEALAATPAASLTQSISDAIATGFRNLCGQTPRHAQPGTTAMTDAEIKALVGTELAAKLATLKAELLTALNPAETGKPAETAAPAAQAAPPAPPVIDFKAELEKQTAAITALTTKLTEAMATAQGTAGGKQTGAADPSKAPVL
jgi:hypothetical protein